MTTLDYSLKTCEERTECVKQVIASTPKEQLTQKYLNYLIVIGANKFLSSNIFANNEI